MELKIENITYKESKIILNKINLDLKSDKISFLVSSNYKKLKNLLNIISINQQPTSGSIFINGEKLTKNNIKELKQNIGFCPNKNHFIKDTIKEEIEYISKKYKDSIKEKRIINTLKMVNLPISYLDKDPNKLSSGEKQKLSLALVLVHNPKIIILENPTQNLDSTAKNHLIKLLKLMKLRYNKNIIIVSKDEELILQLADEIYILENDISKYNDKYEFFQNKEIIKRLHLNTPKTIEFSNLVKNKYNINIGFRDNINDLIKDIYRFVNY